MSFGWLNENTCNHLGGWETNSVAGYGVMHCSGCGKSFYLWQKEPGGSLVWMPMERLSEEEAKRVVDLEQKVSPVQAEEDERSVLPESGEERRERPPVQALSKCPELESGAGEGEAVL